MLSGLKIKNRMLLGYSIPVLIYLGFAGLVYSNVRHVTETFENVERVENALIQGSEMGISFQGMVRTTRGYLIYKDEQALERFVDTKNAFELAAQNADSFLIDLDQKQRVDQMVELAKEYDALSAELIRLKRESKQAEIEAIFAEGKGRELISQFDEIYDEFITFEKALLDENTSNARRELNTLLIAVVIGTFLIIVLAVIIALIISSGITRTVNRATSAIAASSTEISVTVEQQERSAGQQAVSVQQTTTTMDELSASSRQSAERAELSVANGKQVLVLAEAGTQAVVHTLEDMATLKAKVGTIAEQILHLNEQTNQIGNIANLVSDLANQTNMLALNAAVEAVRAGENGKGFSVVASEIRKLADQSKGSAGRINALVADIQNAIRSSVSATEEGTKTVEQGVKTAEGTAETFVDVTNAINSIVLSSEQISLNAKQQAAAIQQVVTAMNVLSQGANETAKGITQTKVGTQKLNEAALSLQAII